MSDAVSVPLAGATGAGLLTTGQEAGHERQVSHGRTFHHHTLSHRPGPRSTRSRALCGDGEHAGVCRHLRLEETLRIGHRCPDRIVHRGPLSSGTRPTEVTRAVECALRQGIHPQQRRLSRLHPGDVSLVNPELELQRVGPAQCQQEIAFLE